MGAEPLLPPEALDRLLHGIPLHVLYFDHALRCRYAAPDGPHFLGRSWAALLGTPASQIFPTTLPVVSQLERVLTTRVTWWGEQLPYPAGPNGAWAAGHWNVQAQPWTLGTPVAATAVPAATMPATPAPGGVLVSCLPCERAASGDPTAVALFDEGRRSAVLLEGIRTQLTVIRGYAGLLQRRSSAQPADVVATRIDGAVRQLTELLATYEAATQLRIQHPDAPS